MKSPSVFARNVWRSAVEAIAVFLFCAGLACAQQAAQKDYSKGFKKFYELGLPDAGKAVYVKLDLYEGGFHGADAMSMSVLNEMRLSGNAWMLREDKTAGKATFIMNNCRLVEVYDNKALAKEREAKLKAEREKQKGKSHPPAAVFNRWGQGADGKTGGQWKQADLKKDVEKVIAYLKKNQEAAQRRDMLAYSGGYGSLLLSAIHFHRQGLTNEANRIVGMLFEASPDQRKVIEQGMNIVADSQFEDACRAFFKNGNWAAYSKALDALQTRFSVGWKKASAAKMLADRVRTRAGQAQAPAISGEGITAEDSKLAAELVKATDGNLDGGFGFQPFAGGGLWILPGAGWSGMPSGWRPAQTGILERITGRGMKSVPLLMALLKDDYLTSLDLQKLTGFHASFVNSMFMDGEESGDMAEEMYNSLHRPASRSDIAVLLLKPLVPQSEPRSYSRKPPDRDELLANCKEWYNAHKNQSPAELARFYMKDGDDQQQNAGLMHLLKSGTDSDMAAIEEHLLNSENPMNAIGMVQQYIMKRGAKAKSFVEKYEVAAKKAMETGSNRASKNENYKKMMTQQLESLKSMVSSAPLETILNDILTGKMSLELAGHSLFIALARKKPDEALTIILETAVKAQKPDLCRNLVYSATQVPYMGQFAAMYGAEEPANEPEKAKLDIKKHAELWKKLLADARVPAESQMWGWGGHANQTVGEAAAYAIEMIYNAAEDDLSEGPGEDQAMLYMLGQRGTSLVKARAEARLAGKPESQLPAYPSASKVTPEQRKKLVDRLMNAPAATLEKEISALSLDNLLALSEETEKNEKLNAKLAPLANRVNKVSGKTEKPETLTRAQSEKGKQVSKTMVEQMLALCKRFTAEGKVANCTITRQPCMGGTEIWLGEMLRTDNAFMGMGMHHGLNKAIVNASIGGSSDLNASAMWYVGQSAAAATDPDDAMQENMAESQEEFWKTVEKYCAGQGNVCEAAVIQISGTPVLPKDKNKNQGADDDEDWDETVIDE